MCLFICLCIHIYVYIYIYIYIYISDLKVSEKLPSRDCLLVGPPFSDPPPCGGRWKTARGASVATRRVFLLAGWSGGPPRGEAAHIVSYSYRRISDLWCHWFWKTIFFPDHATISAAIPATICLCIVLNRKSIHDISPLCQGRSLKFVCLTSSLSREIRSARVCAWHLRKLLTAILMVGALFQKT